MLSLDVFFFSPFSAESVINDMVGPDWKQRWMHWTNRTADQVSTGGTLSVPLCPMLSYDLSSKQSFRRTYIC